MFSLLASNQYNNTIMRAHKWKPALGNTVASTCGFIAETSRKLKATNIAAEFTPSDDLTAIKKNVLTRNFQLTKLNGWDIEAETLDNEVTLEIAKKRLRELGGEHAELAETLQVGQRLALVKINGESKHLVLDKDTRISVNNAGKILVEQGSVIYQKGKLTSNGDNNLLFRMSDVDVEGGDGTTTLFNFSSNSGGTFTGGNGGLAMYGDYNNATILGGSGKNTFAGSFVNSTITGGDNTNTYSGAFITSIIEGGASVDEFSGIFVSGSMVNGNAGDDTFYGTFSDSSLSGGKGYNQFGVQLGANYQGVGEALLKHSNQFYSVTLDAGEKSRLEGFFGHSEINLGKEAEVKGVFNTTTVNNTTGNAKITAFYAKNSTFQGETGTTDLHIRTGVESAVSLGEGENTVTMGKLRNASTSAEFLGMTMDLNFVTWGRLDELADGSLSKNKIDASRGITHLEINTTDEYTKYTIDASKAGETDENTTILASEAEQKKELLDSLDTDTDTKEKEEDEERDSSTIIRDSLAMYSHAKDAAVDVTFLDGLAPTTYTQSEGHKKYKEITLRNFHSKPIYTEEPAFKAIL